MASSVSFSGVASGIDTESLVNSAINAKREQRITPLEDKISETEDESGAITTLKEKFLTLKDKLSKINTLTGGAVKKSASSSDELVVSALASSVANQGSYDITISRLAKRGSFTMGTRFSSQSDLVSPGIGSSQTITISVGTGDNKKTSNITISSTTTVADMVDAINSSNIGCEAVCVNVGSTSNPSYTVMISSLNEGLSKGTIEVTTESTNSNIENLINNGTLTQAQNSMFSIAGLASDIERDSNTIADTIPGVTFSLQSVGAATVAVSNDVDSTESGVQEIIDVLNDIFTFVSENNTVERQEDGEEVTNIFAALSKTTVDNNAIQSIKAAIVATKEESGTYVRIFADFGITTNSKDGTLNFDTDKFEEAFAKEANSINSILTQFADTLSSTGGTIDQYTRYNGLFDVIVNNNTNRITDYNERIARYEAMLATEEENLRARYARFESLMSELQNSASSLTSLLG